MIDVALLRVQGVTNGLGGDGRAARVSNHDRAHGAIRHCIVHHFERIEIEGQLLVSNVEEPSVRGVIEDVPVRPLQLLGLRKWLAVAGNDCSRFHSDVSLLGRILSALGDVSQRSSQDCLAHQYPCRFRPAREGAACSENSVLCGIVMPVLPDRFHFSPDLPAFVALELR
jgi:hypothetical protein